MLGSFRRLIFSPAGKIIALAALVLIALAFAAGDIMGFRPSGGVGGATIAEVGDARVSDTELRNRVQETLNIVRREQPTVDMGQFLAGGGFESVVERIVNGLALYQFGQASGLHVSDRVVDGEIASIPAFQGLDGKFDQARYEQLLSQQRITPQQLREDIRRELMAQWLIAPTIGASQVSNQLALPYASLLLEKRHGEVGFIPASAVSVPAPTDGTLQKFYAENRARYTVPERRVIKYALVTPERVAAQAQPTEAEIAAAYQQQRARFAPTEQRSVTQVIVADQAAANELAAKVKSGQSIEAAAQAAGLEPSTLSNVTRDALAGQTSPEVASAVFGAAEGAVVGPVRGPIGWHVLRVTSVRKIPGKTLAEARDELAAEIRARKAAEAMAALQDSVDEGINEGATFDELVADAKLQAARTPPVTASGIDPDQPGSRPDPRLSQVVEAGFAAQQGDQPQIVPVGRDGTFALVGLERIVPAAPRPLAQIRERVEQDYLAEQRMQAARRIAASVVAKVNGGTSLGDAIRQAGVRTPPVQPINASRAQLAAARGQLPPALSLMFSMAEKKAKLAASPAGDGWFVVYLDRIERGNAQGNPAVIRSTRAGLGSVIGREYAEQFTRAAGKAVGVRRNAEAIARVKSELAGQAAPAN